MRTLVDCLIVGAGGAAGAIARHGIGELARRWLPEHFAYGTLAANLIGCFLIGVLLGSEYGRDGFAKLGLSVGFLGGLTTFSTFSAETFGHLDSNQWPLALLNVAANLVLGLLFVAIGIYAGKKLAS